MLNFQNKLCRYVLAVVLFVSCASCHTENQVSRLSQAQSTQNLSRVQPRQYHAFWLWGTPKNKAALSQSKTLYVLQGHVYKASAEVVRQGTDVLVAQKQIWLVYRTDGLHWDDSTMQSILNRITYWENKGQRIAGIQVDFDAATHKLADYGAFLKMVRKHLPKNYQLSITGLLDWTNLVGHGLERHIKPYIDEIIIQTYQKTTTVPEYQRYLKKLIEIKMPFKVGLIEQGIWQPAVDLSSNPYFAGYVVFLLQDIINK